MSNVQHNLLVGPKPAVGFGIGKKALTSQGAKLAEKAVADIPYEKVSEPVYRFFKRLGADRTNTGLWNLSMEDWASRFNTMVAVYIPQSVISLLENKHIFETIGRNLLVWTLTFAILAYNKNDKLSINSLLFNKFMTPKALGGDYFEMLKQAGIQFKPEDMKKAYWANLDDNALSKVFTLEKELKQRLADNSIIGIKEAEKTLALIPRFMRRRIAFSLASTALIVAMTTYIVGKLAMQFVFKFIAPLDHDFDPSKSADSNKKGAGKARPRPTPEFPRTPADSYLEMIGAKPLSSRKLDNSTLQPSRPVQTIQHPVFPSPIPQPQPAPMQVSQNNFYFHQPTGTWQPWPTVQGNAPVIYPPGTFWPQGAAFWNGQPVNPAQYVTPQNSGIQNTGLQNTGRLM